VGALPFVSPVRLIRAYINRHRGCGAHSTRGTYRLRKGEWCAVPQADRKLLPNGPHLTRVRHGYLFVPLVILTMGLLLDLQIGDDGSMYKGVCQRRAIRVLSVGKVESGCLRMTRRAWYRGSIQTFHRWDLKHINKTFLYRVLWSSLLPQRSIMMCRTARQVIESWSQSTTRSQWVTAGVAGVTGYQ
jgi:hypothetical protein